jgi:predicted Zn-dependent protease
MAKQIGRRDFLKKTFAGIGSFLIASKLQAINSATDLFSEQENLPLAAPNLMPLYRQAKEYFYQKNYSDAIALFLQLIENNPNTIFLYDGLAKVYNAQQNLAGAAQLFKNGVNANPNNAHFLGRYSMSIKNLCVGNPMQAQQFSSQNNISNLYETAAQKLLDAIALNPQQKGFKLDLKDFPKLMEKFNENPRNAAFQLALSEDILTQINSATNSVADSWSATRTSRKPNIPPENGNNYGNRHRRRRNKRNLHNNHEKAEREKSEKKNQKRVHYSYFRNNAGNKNTNKAEQWGLQILTDDIKDTNIVGKMRNYFKKNKNYDRIVPLNRYFYSRNESIYTALALAASLVRYGNNNSLFNEAKELLNSVNQHFNNFTSVAKGAYYITSAKIKVKENNRSEARNILLEGVQNFDGKGGIAYSIMEHYAATFSQQEKTTAINIQKALCNKNIEQINDPIWIFLEKYRAFLNENEINTTEKIKALIALSKLQKKFNDSGYNATINEINASKSS